MRQEQRRNVRGFYAVAAAAVVAVSPMLAAAGVENDPGFANPGVEYVVSTSGATALGAFTRARNSDGSYNRGPIRLGSDTLRIGRTVYTQGLGQGIGIADKGSIAGNEPGLNNDRIVYKYHETGSIAGLLELVDSNGLLLPGLTPARPLDPSSGNPLYINGNRFLLPGGAAAGGYTAGANFDAQGNPLNPQLGQEYARIAWTDVRFEQGFAVSGASGAVNRRPLDAGYGKGRGNIGNTNYQRLRSADVLEGGLAPATTRLRNESLAVVPFNVTANPGTGLARITKEEGKWLNVAGRLPNGANFNVPTRDSGSGTRNQGVNNLGADPTWGGGERDRIATGTFQATDPDGVLITINPGDEADPRRRLDNGSLLLNVNENRIGIDSRFSDKTSGGTGIRPITISSRMAAGGILSSGDTGSAGRAGTADGNAIPIRALAIDWGNGAGYVQAKARDVTEGRYEMWSASQAVTVSPTANPQSTDTDAPGGRPILGDTDDDGSGVGIHRKFLDNITRSVANFPDNTNQTPADAILRAGYILPQIMNVTKVFDGDAQVSSPRSNVDPDGAGPNRSPQQVWEIVTSNNSGSADADGANPVAGGDNTLYTALNWANASTHNGNLAGGAVRYGMFAPTNTAGLGSGNDPHANADKTVIINARTNLAGDFNNDQVRDLNDVESLARAYVSPTNYLATPEGAGVAASTVSTASNRLGAAQGNEGLIVLSDFNSDGNVRESAPGVYTTDAVERDDVKYFLYGAAVDTVSANAATGYLGSLNAQTRREDGVRMGRLMKNAAIDRFNAELDALVDDGQAGDVAGFTQEAADLRKFNKFEINRDGVVNLYDAKLVKQQMGKSITNLNDHLSAEATGSALLNSVTSVTRQISLIDVELNDDTVVNATDYGLIQAQVRGDFDLNGEKDFVDIDPLISALTDADSFVAGLTDVSVSDLSIVGDFDDSGEFDFGDIDGFVGLLTGTSLPLALELYSATSFEFAQLSKLEGIVAVPEPGTLGISAVGALGLLARRRRRA